MIKVPVITQKIIPLNSDGSAYKKIIKKDGECAIRVVRVPFAKKDVLFRRPYATQGYRLHIKNFDTGKSTCCTVTQSTFPLDRRIDGISIPADEKATTINVLRKRTDSNGKSRSMKKFRQTKTDKSSRTEIIDYNQSGEIITKFIKFIQHIGQNQTIEHILEKFNPNNRHTVPFRRIRKSIVTENGSPVATQRMV